MKTDNPSPTIEDAIQLALIAHRGQQDRSGQPYILHPLRVMMAQTHNTARLVAILHDVVEDSDITLEDLRAGGYSEEVVTAIDRLTRHANQTYDHYIERIAEDDLARHVKLADLADNMDVRRLRQVTEADVERLARYRAAWERLTSGS